MSTRDKLARRLERKARDDLTPADVLEALKDLTVPQRNSLLGAIQSGNAAMVGGMVMGAVRSRVQAMATARADTMLADGSITEAELEQVL